MSNILTKPAVTKYKTFCKLCPQSEGAYQKIAEAPSLDIPIVGDPGKRAKDFLGTLGKHLTKHHAQQFAEGLAMFQEFQAYLIFSAFEFEDPTITPKLEMIRAAIFAMVRKNSLSDDSLRHLVAGWGLDPDDAKKVLDGFKAIRDVLCEVGVHAPKITSNLIVPA